MKFSVIKFIVSVVLVLMPLTGFSQNNQQNPVKDSQYVFDILLTYSEDFFDANENSDDINPVGSFFGNSQTSIAFSVNFPYHYFQGDHFSNAGYYYNYNMKKFSFNRQDTTITSSAVTETDLGTSVSGFNIYAFASMFYNFGEKYIKNDEDQSFKIGLGVGAGYLKADGDIILTERVSTPRVNIDISDFGFVYGMYADYRRGFWTFRVEVFSTAVKYGGLNYEYFTIPLQVGYSFLF